MSASVARGQSDLTPEQHNRHLLFKVASRMGAVCDQLVFIGGMALPWLITEPQVCVARRSKDVDVLFDWTDKNDLYAFEDALWDLGFEKQSGGAVGRWRLEDMRLDVLSADPQTVGSNTEWFGEAWQSASAVRLNDDLAVKILSGPALLATKLSAFDNRGRGRYFGSSDIADVLVLCAGRSRLNAELARYPASKLRMFVKNRLQALHAAFADAQDAASGRYLKDLPAPVRERALERIAQIIADESSP